VLRLNLDNEVKEDASVSDITSAIRRLDGAAHSLVLIELLSGRTLTIGGGPDRFVAEIAENDTLRWSVVDPSGPEGSIDLVAGGQLADFAARLCVDLEAVLEAARHFASGEGTRSPKLVWSQET
jgi:hypothetical protein